MAAKWLGVPGEPPPQIDFVEGGYLLMANQIQPGLLGSMMPLMGAELGEWMGQMKRVGGTIAWIDDPADELGELKLAKDGTT